MTGVNHKGASLRLPLKPTEAYAKHDAMKLSGGVGIRVGWIQDGTRVGGEVTDLNVLLTYVNAMCVGFL